MNNKVLAGIVVVVVIIVIAAAAALSLGNNSDERGTEVTTGVNYYGNGGATLNGDTVYGRTMTTVQQNEFVYEGHIFTGWNTAADGSGTSYAVGSTIEYGEGTVSLYAQWSYSIRISETHTGPIGLDSRITQYLVSGDGQQTISLYGGTYALPSEGVAGIAIGIEGVSTWEAEDGAFIGTDTDGNTYRLTIEITGAEPDTVVSGDLASWSFTVTGPVSCQITVSEHQNYS